MNERRAYISTDNTGSFVEYENDAIVYSKDVKFDSREQAEEARKHFLGEYSGFDPIGDWED